MRGQCGSGRPLQGSHQIRSGGAGSVAGKKALLIVVVTRDLEKRFHAGNIVKAIAAVGGRRGRWTSRYGPGRWIQTGTPGRGASESLRCDCRNVMVRGAICRRGSNKKGRLFERLLQLVGWRAADLPFDLEGYLDHDAAFICAARDGDDGNSRRITDLVLSDHHTGH